jgi:sulfite exporter TauE/SafE
MWQILLSGFSLGLISSLHCVGMCGPLMLALPVRHLNRVKQLTAIFLYNIGRVFTYSLIGVLVGLAGRRIYLAGLQQWLSITMGIAILVIALTYFFWKKSLQPAWMVKAHIRIQEAMSVLLQTKSNAGYFLLGATNGLLPCGMVYMAIAGAFMAPVIEQSIFFMLFFGAGTLPAMLAFGYFGMRVSLSARQKMRKALPVFVIGVAIWLILRGMNLGIPFVSPIIEDPGQGISCHT